MAENTDLEVRVTVCSCGTDMQYLCKQVTLSQSQIFHLGNENNNVFCLPHGVKVKISDNMRGRAL